MKTRSGKAFPSPDSPQQDEASTAKRQKLEAEARSRPVLPNENFPDVLKCLDRDTLDSVIFVCQFMSNFISLDKDDQLALRVVAQVCLGEVRT
ncbi:hypothetical protein AAVH_27056 [Aphelenchoides avenae]|nr:hypothetical protein AAVH_27056 [Aphelenchus avenae]